MFKQVLPGEADPSINLLQAHPSEAHLLKAVFTANILSWYNAKAGDCGFKKIYIGCPVRFAIDRRSTIKVKTEKMASGMQINIQYYVE